MNPEPDRQESTARFESAAWGIGLAVVALAVTVMVIAGAARERYTLWVWLGAAWLVIVLGGFALGYVGRWRGWRWARRAESAASILVVLWIAGVFVGHPIAQLAGLAPGRPSNGLIVVIGALWLAIGLALHIWSLLRPETESNHVLCSPASVIAWPLLFFLKSPLLGTVLVVLPFALVSAGYWLGGKVGHPYAGAVAMVAGLAACALLARGRNRPASH